MKKLTLALALFATTSEIVLAQNKYDPWFERHSRAPNPWVENYTERQYRRNRPQNRPTTNRFRSRSKTCYDNPYTGNVTCQ